MRSLIEGECFSPLRWLSEDRSTDCRAFRHAVSLAARNARFVRACHQSLSEAGYGESRVIGLRSGFYKSGRLCHASASRLRLKAAARSSRTAHWS
jgi:hypothetical protein